jgi:hypothetical protein
MAKRMPSQWQEACQGSGEQGRIFILLKYMGNKEKREGKPFYFKEALWCILHPIKIILSAFCITKCP